MDSSPEPGAISSSSSDVSHNNSPNNRSPKRSVDSYRPPPPPPPGAPPLRPVVPPTVVDRYVPHYVTDTYIPPPSPPPRYIPTTDTYIPPPPRSVLPKDRSRSDQRVDTYIPPPRSVHSTIDTDTYFPRPCDTYIPRHRYTHPDPQPVIAQSTNKPIKHSFSSPTLIKPPPVPKSPQFSSVWTLQVINSAYTENHSLSQKPQPHQKRHVDPNSWVNDKRSDPRLATNHRFKPLVRPHVWPLKPTNIIFDMRTKHPLPTVVVMAYLDRSWTEHDIKTQVSVSGKVIYVRLAKREDLMSLGIARVKFATSDGCSECVSMFDGRRGGIPGEFLLVEVDQFGTKYTALVAHALSTRPNNSWSSSEHERLKLPKRPYTDQRPSSTQTRPNLVPVSHQQQSKSSADASTVVAAAIKTLRVASHTRIYRSLIDMDCIWSQIRDRISIRVDQALNTPATEKSLDEIMDHANTENGPVPWSNVVDQFPSFKKAGAVNKRGGSASGSWGEDRQDDSSLDDGSTSTGTSEESQESDGSEWSGGADDAPKSSPSISNYNKKKKRNGPSDLSVKLMDVDNEYEPEFKPFNKPRRTKKRLHVKRQPNVDMVKPARIRPITQGIPFRWDVLDYMPPSFEGWRDRIVPKPTDVIDSGLDWIENELVQLLAQVSVSSHQNYVPDEISGLVHAPGVKRVVRNHLMQTSATAMGLWRDPIQSSTCFGVGLSEMFDTICPPVSTASMLVDVLSSNRHMDHDGIQPTTNMSTSDSDDTVLQVNGHIPTTTNTKSSSAVSELPPTCARLCKYTKIPFALKLQHRLPKSMDPLTIKERTIADLVNSSSRQMSSTNNPIGMTESGLGPLKSRCKRVKIARSSIHSWGMYALEPIEANEFIIEYVGEIVRQIVADKRERQYLAAEESGGASYLFRQDEEYVVDATKCGNYARFINHSCDPNSTARIITVDGEKKIVIYASKLILMGAEITYDYKFEFEEGEDRIVCLCRARNCRGYLN